MHFAVDNIIQVMLCMHLGVTGVIRLMMKGTSGGLDRIVEIHPATSESHPA